MYDYQLVINGNMQPIEHIFLIKVERGFFLKGGVVAIQLIKASLSHTPFYTTEFLTGLTPDGFPAGAWGLGEPSKFSHLSCIKVKEIQGSLTSQMVALALTTKVQEFFGAG